MGIGLTLQKVEGWEGQFNRMVRFYDRACTAAKCNNYQDEMDFSLAVFHHALNLRDWVHEICPEARRNLEKLFANNIEMRMCRDISNGFKHMKISKASIDNEFSIVFEFNPRGGRQGEMVILGGGYKFEFLELAGKCVDKWKGFVLENNLKSSVK